MDEMKPKKGLAALLIAGKKPEMEEEDEIDGQTVAVEDMMAAWDERDIESFKMALNAFLDQR